MSMPKGRWDECEEEGGGGGGGKGRWPSYEAGSYSTRLVFSNVLGRIPLMLLLVSKANSYCDTEGGGGGGSLQQQYALGQLLKLTSISMPFTRREGFRGSRNCPMNLSVTFFSSCIRVVCR